MKRVLTESDIKEFHRSGKTKVEVSPGDIITPAARDVINQYKMIVVFKNEENSSSVLSKTSRIAIGCDHTGLEMKSTLKKLLQNKNYKLIDVGTDSSDSCDYPDFAAKVAEEVQSGNCDFGIMIDATGIPSAITANKFKGIRAATCYNEFSAWSARNHNNANILVLGAKTLGEETAKSILIKWMQTDFEGGRHQRRLDKITDIENS